MASEGWHESAAELRSETRDLHRALTSLMEELEALDWYGQRVNTTGDTELRAILAQGPDTNGARPKASVGSVRENR